MSMIDVTNLNFTYEGSYDPVFENLSLKMDTDWKLGFTGRNGKGKTTFLNILAGKLDYSGKIVSTVIFDVFPFDIPDKNQSTIDNLYMVDSYIELWKLQKELHLLEVDEEVLYRPYYSLSNGEQTKVMLATMFSRENRFLLIDEPTNHLDAEGRKLLRNYLNKKKGFILVSHDRVFLDNVVDHMLIINKTSIEIQQGNFSSWWSNKTMRDQNEIAENEKLNKEISRLEKSSKQSAEWSSKVEKSKNRTQPKGQKPDAGSKIDKGYVGHKSAKMMKRSLIADKRKENASSEKKKLLKDVEKLEPLSIKTEKYFKSRLIDAVDLTIKYDESIVFDNINFSIDEGDRIALCGKNGSGKSSILKLIMGDDIDYYGRLSIGSQLKISYIPQDATKLSGKLEDYAEKYKIDEAIFKAILWKMDFPRVQFEKDMKDLSDGQKKKVFLARSLCEPANLFVWDEPMNYIDVFTRIQIERLMESHNPTMIFVEHDEEFVKKIATKRILL